MSTASYRWLQHVDSDETLSCRLAGKQHWCWEIIYNHKHSHIDSHKLERTHDDLVMERFGCDPGDSWGHEAQLTGYEKYAHRRAPANIVDVPLRFRNDKMDHCQCSQGSCDWVQTGSDNSRAVICAARPIATSSIHNGTSFAWMPLWHECRLGLCELNRSRWRS